MEIDTSLSFGFVTKCGFVRYKNTITMEYGWYDAKGKPCEAPANYQTAYKIRLDRKIKGTINVDEKTKFKLVVLPNAVFVSIANYTQIKEVFNFAIWCNHLVVRNRKDENVAVSYAQIDDDGWFEDIMEFIEWHKAKCNNYQLAKDAITSWNNIGSKEMAAKLKAEFKALFLQMPIDAIVAKEKVEFESFVEGYFGGESEDCYFADRSKITVDGFKLQSGKMFLDCERGFSRKLLTSGWENAKNCIINKVGDKYSSQLIAVIRDDFRILYVCYFKAKSIESDSLETTLQLTKERLASCVRIDDESFIC